MTTQNARVRRVLNCLMAFLMPSLMLLAVAWVNLPQALAQLPTATVLGTVKDASGAVVPGASVNVRNTETGLLRTAETSADGRFRFPALSVGAYEVRVEHAGFQAAVRSGLTLAVLDEAVVSLRHGGRLVIVADPHDIAVPARLVMLHELSVIGAVGYDGEFAEAIRLLASGKVDLSALVTHRFPLSRIEEAFAMQRNAGEAGKVLVLAKG